MHAKECLSKDNLASSEEPPFRRRWLKRREEEREEETVPLHALCHDLAKNGGVIAHGRRTL